MTDKPIQDYYPEETSHCYGCGYSNAEGLQLKSYWNGGKSTATYTPDPRYAAIPGYVYGGLIASLIDCHGTATASAAACHAQNRALGDAPLPRFVTAGIKVDFVRPTPLGTELSLRGKAVAVKERKVVVEITLAADGEVCAIGRVVAVTMPESMLGKRG